MASSSHSTRFVVPHPRPLSVEPYRDLAGLLPLVPYSKCEIILIGHVSQKTGSKGKMFYKCPLLEHTNFACHTYIFEDEYVEYLVAKGHSPRGCSQIRGRDHMALEVVQACNNTVKTSDMVKICHSVEAYHDLLQSAVIHLKDSEAMLKILVDTHITLNNKVYKIGERLLVLGVAKLFVLVLVLLVLLVK